MTDDSGMGPPQPETVGLGCDLVKLSGPGELESFAHRTFAASGRASLGDLRRAIERRRRELTP